MRSAVRAFVAILAGCMSLALLLPRPEHPNHQVRPTAAPHRIEQASIGAGPTTTTVGSPAPPRGEDIARYATASYLHAVAVHTTTTTTTRAPQRPSAPRQAPPAAVTPSGSCQGTVAAVFGSDAAWALRIAARESHCTTDARNPTPCASGGQHAVGVFQLCMPMHSDIPRSLGCDYYSSLECQVRSAYALMQSSGKGPWKL